MATNENNNVQETTGQTQNTATATQTQPNTAAAQNVYGAQQGYTYGAYDTNAQANPYNTNYYTQTSQQTTSSENNYYNSQVSGDVFDEVFVEKGETPVATLSNGMVLNLISGEG